MKLIYNISTSFVAGLVPADRFMGGRVLFLP